MNSNYKKSKKYLIIIVLMLLLISIGVPLITDTPPVIEISGRKYWGFSSNIRFENITLTKKDINNLKRMRYVKKAEFIVDEFDISCLDGMSNLKELTIAFTGNYKVENWDSLRNCEKIEHFCGLNLKITDLSIVKDMAELKVLYIESIGATNIKSSNIKDISDIKGLINIEKFSVSGNNITDISSLSNLLKLKQLSLFGTNCDDYSVLLTLPSLESLDIEKDKLPKLLVEKLKENGVEVFEWEVVN